MKFTEAFNLLYYGVCVEGIRLPKWSEDVIIRLQRPDEASANTHPYLYRKSMLSCVPWMPTVPELFSEDWEIIEIECEPVPRGGHKYEK